jgi:hypothetical protein
VTKSGGNIEIYADPLRRNIVDCEECNLGQRYCPELRARNLRFLQDYAPEARIEKIIIAESPPVSYKYIYDMYSGCTRKSFSYRVFRDLKYVGLNEIVDDSRKGKLLGKMKEEGILVMDCCQCAVNHLKSGHRKERDEGVINCFDLYTKEVLKVLYDRHKPELFFKFPRKRGKKLLRMLDSQYGDGVIERVPY